MVPACLFILLAFQTIYTNGAIELTPGRTTAAPGWKRLGNHLWYPLPLIAMGNNMPYLEGTHGAFVPSSTKQYTVFGSMDGIGIELVGDQYYVYVNHEYSVWHESHLPGDSETFMGARMSLFVFSKDFQIVGGRNLVTAKFSGSTGAEITTPFGGLCAAILVHEGFIGGPHFISSEEGDGAYNSWAVNVRTGVATRIEGCGAIHHENTVVASQYLPSRNHPSKKTVFLTTDDSPSGEVFLFTGDQTEEDPNGFSSGTLHVLRVQDFHFEHMEKGVVYTGTWTPIPNEIAFAIGKDGYNALDAWVNTDNRSTNFRKIEDCNEDPNTPGTFYFAATGGPFTTNGSTIPNSECALKTEGGCDNPFGKIYRITVNPTTPSGPCEIELLLEGNHEDGGAYDNLCPTRDGKILILEDPTPTVTSEIYRPQERYAQILEFNPNDGSVQHIFEVDYATLYPTAAPFTKHLSHSGIVEFGDTSNPMFMIALQSVALNTTGDALSDAGLKIFSGQLAILVRKDAEVVTSEGTLVSYGHIETPQYYYYSNNGGLIAALVVGWVVAGVCGLLAIILAAKVATVGSSTNV